MDNILPDINTSFLAKEARKVAEVADENLLKLDGHLKNHEDPQNYFFGVLRRQTIILKDLALLLELSQTKNVTSHFILCRCLCDDFITIFYLKLNPDEAENITRINSEARYESFKSINVLTLSNEKHFKGKYPFYLDSQQYKGLKEKFLANSENHKYLRSVEEFDFKKFMQLRQIAEKIEDFELSKISPRAYYLWSYFSGFVHYSSMTLHAEMYATDNTQINLRMIEETIMYSFNTIELAFRYFSKAFGLEFKTDENLSDRYLIKYN